MVNFHWDSCVWSKASARVSFEWGHNKLKKTTQPTWVNVGLIVLKVAGRVGKAENTLLFWYKTRDNISVLSIMSDSFGAVWGVIVLLKLLCGCILGNHINSRGLFSFFLASFFTFSFKTRSSPSLSSSASPCLFIVDWSYYWIMLAFQLRFGGGEKMQSLEVLWWK